MAYTPNPNREVKDGKAMVSAKELADFKSQYGEDKTLRDLLNADKGLRRRGGDSAPVKPSQDASKTGGEAVGSRTTQPPKKEGGIGPYNVGAGPSEEEKQAAYSKYAENRKKMGASDDDSGSKPISESDWAKSVRSSQSSDSGFLGKKMREAMGSSYKKGGSVRSSASSRADGIAQRGKTKGRIV